MATPTNNPPDEPQQPPDHTPDLRSPDRFGPFLPPIKPAPVRPLDYGRPNDFYQAPRRGGPVLSILAGLGVTIATLAAGVTARGGYSAAPLVLAAIVFGISMTLMVRTMGLLRAIGRLALGLLLLFLLGYGCLLAVCGGVRI